MTEYYAHSGDSERGVPPQTYYDHVQSVYEEVVNGSCILSPMLCKAVVIAALFHDFGKLDADSQIVLSRQDRDEDAKIKNHVDAGVAWCLREYNSSEDVSFVYAAYLIHAHHIGLQNRCELYTIKPNLEAFRDDFVFMEGFRDQNIKSDVDAMLDSLYDIQYKLLGPEIECALGLTFQTSNIKAIDLRFALSVLVEADHGDTSRNYGTPNFDSLCLMPEVRFQRLQQRIFEVRDRARNEGISDRVISSRNKLFEKCSNIEIDSDRFYFCPAPTGKGKTLSLMNLALRIARERKNKDRLFFIIPFTNIISQSVKEYRRAVILPDEIQESVVNEIHSKVEFQSFYFRKYSKLWNAPINVSTSVQFFESLFSNHPSAVRKLKQFANSVVVFDEYHTAMDHHLWNVSLKVLHYISERYNIDFVFGSGTHVLYWDIFDYNFNVKYVVDDKTFDDFKKDEDNRIGFEDIGEFDAVVNLYERVINIVSEDGSSAFMVFNTIKNSILATRYFVENTNWKIYHISTWLCPRDRERILSRIKDDLRNGEMIFVISTSVLECGHDLSFKMAFRERGAYPSILQAGGRTNRNHEYDYGIIYEFSISQDFINQSLYTRNAGLNASLASREGIEINIDGCTSVVLNELKNYLGRKCQFKMNENEMNFSEMDNSFKIIPNLTATVIIDQSVADKIRNGEFVSSHDINMMSVEIYRDKIDKEFKDFVEEIDDDLYCWIGEYDDMLGIGRAYVNMLSAYNPDT